jgi:ribonuclease P protein component
LREFSLRKIDRLRKSIDYKKLNLSGKKIENHEFILIYKTNVLKNSRLGITVSKKVGNAVERNRIKRIAREFFRTNRYLFIMGGVDLNVIAKRSSSPKSNHDLFDSLKEVVKKIDIKNRI